MREWLSLAVLKTLPACGKWAPHDAWADALKPYIFLYPCSIGVSFFFFFGPPCKSFSGGLPMKSRAQTRSPSNVFGSNFILIKISFTVRLIMCKLKSSIIEANWMCWNFLGELHWWIYINYKSRFGIMARPLATSLRKYIAFLFFIFYIEKRCTFVVWIQKVYRYC